jgi:hypothetical protein
MVKSEDELHKRNITQQMYAVRSGMLHTTASILYG